MNILIVVDMQKDFVDGALGTPEARAIVPAVVDKIPGHPRGGLSVYPGGEKPAGGPLCQGHSRLGA